MKLDELIMEEKVSIKSVETSPRIEKKAMAGYYAVLQGKKVWKSNLLTADEARAVKATYDSTKHGHPPLRVVYLTK